MIRNSGFRTFTKELDDVTDRRRVGRPVHLNFVQKTFDHILGATGKRQALTGSQRPQIIAICNRRWWHSEAVTVWKATARLVVMDTSKQHLRRQNLAGAASA